MSYRNLNNLEKLWRDNPVHHHSRNKRRYYKVPNPGRPFENCVSLQVLLKLHGLKLDNVLVNGNVVKDRKYPVAYMDYVSVNGESYYVNVVNQGKKHRIILVSNDHDYLYYPVKRWYTHRGSIVVNTFQNKNFNLPVNRQVIQLLRSHKVVLVDGVLVDVMKTKSFHLVKITGKDKYVAYKVIDWSKDNSFINLTLMANQAVKHVKIHHLDFHKRYVWKIIDGVKPL